MICKELQERLLNNYQQWLDNKEVGFDKLNIEHWLFDYGTFRDFFYSVVERYQHLNTVETFEIFLEEVYKTVNKLSNITSNQTLNEVKNFGYWDINFGSICVTISNYNNILVVSDYYNGYAKQDGIELSEPFEDLEYNTLEQFYTNCKELLQN